MIYIERLKLKFEPSTLNMRANYDIKVEERQLAFNYGMRNLESGNMMG